MNNNNKIITVTLITITLMLSILTYLNFTTYEITEAIEVHVNDCKHKGLMQSTVIHNDIEYIGNTDITAYLLTTKVDNRDDKKIVLNVKTNIFNFKQYKASLK